MPKKTASENKEGLSAWAEVIYQEGVREVEEAQKAIADFDPEALPKFAERYIVGAIAEMRVHFAVEGECRFSKEELLRALREAAQAIQLDCRQMREIP